MQRRRGSCMNDFSQPQCAKAALNVAQDGVGGCFLADRGSKRRCRSLAILAALLSFGGCLRGDAVIDFRNFIEGVPQNWTIPGATPGQRIWVLVMVFST